MMKSTFLDDRIVCRPTDHGLSGCFDILMRKRDADFVASDRPFHSKTIANCLHVNEPSI
jgi:hypothetical protein